MATILPSISSDEEDDTVITTSLNRKLDGQKKGKIQKVPATKEVSSSDEEEDDDAMNDDFEFGGLLGEDGDMTSSSSLLLHHLGGVNNTDNAWSYKSALRLLEQNDASGGKQPVRTNVASIIAAARSNLKKSEETKFKDEDHDESLEEEEVSDSSDSEEEDEEDGVDDAEKVQSMDKDVLKEREMKKTKHQRKEGKITNQSEDNQNSSEEDEEEESESEEDEDEDEETKAERAKAAAYFDATDENNGQQQEIEIFSQLNLSRPLLRGVAAMGFVTPTPIQARVIPVALAGRDVCASAVTGSGKTAAFLLPIMERILQRGGGRVQLSKKNSSASTSATRGLILTPTRELAAQCLGMMVAMAKFTDLRGTLIVGGAKNIQAQASELRTRPDIVIATPGRLLDHLTNSSGVDMDDLEFLILDEADRLLDLGFQDEVHEIVKACPVERQTLLFSATMGTKVDELIKLSLKRPVRVLVSNKKRGGNVADSGGVEVANRLEQEFIRVRTGNEGVNREAMLLALLTRTFTSRTIVFFDTKSDAHRLMIICGLCGIKCTELHGNLTQVQRLEALELFREGEVDVLLATDLAARGLDISSVEAVINFEMPSQVETYVHRIGRTARAGRGGKSCTLIGEGRRHLMKDVMKDAEQKRRQAQSSEGSDRGTASSTGIIRSRTIPPAVVAHFVAKIVSLKPHIGEVLAAEAVARMDRIAEMEAMKAENIIQHQAEINSRPQKEWFASSKQKMSVKEATALKHQQIAEKVGTGVHRMTRKKRRLREAKEDLMEAQEEMRRKCEEVGQQPKKALTDKVVKTAAKAHKKQLANKKQEKESRSIHEEDLIRKERQKEKSNKKRKGVFATDTLGDSSLFGEEKVAYSKVREDKPAPSSYQMREYDPDKARKKTKKKSVKAFKSKSKYKRK